MISVGQTKKQVKLSLSQCLWGITGLTALVVVMIISWVLVVLVLAAALWLFVVGTFVIFFIGSARQYIRDVKATHDQKLPKEENKEMDRSRDLRFTDRSY